MAATDISICNAALSQIGAGRIMDLIEDSEEAAVCNERYEHVRDTVLQVFPWACCTYRATLARDSVAPTYDYQYRYALPTSPLCLSVLECYETDDWRIEGQFLVTNASEVHITYIGKNDDPATYPPYLADLIAARLAIEISYKLSGELNVQSMAAKLYKLKEQEAFEREGKQGNMPFSTDDVYTDPWERARR